MILCLARALFNVFDYGEKGYIDCEEIKRALMMVMEQQTAEEKDDVINYFK